MRYILQKGFIAIFIISIIMLSACDENESSNQENEDTTNETQAASQTTKDEDDEQEDKEEGKQTDKKNEDTDKTKGSATGIEEILKKSAEAMGQVNTLKLIEESESTTDTNGSISHATNESTGEVSLNPTAQHMETNSIEERDGIVEETYTELYLNEEMMYLYDSDTEGWESTSMREDSAFADMSSRITESQLEYFANNHDSFEVSESNDQYILTYSGSGEEFLEIAYGVIKELSGEEAYESITSMITEVSGTYELTINKNTFYVDELMMDFEQTMDMDAFKIHLTEKYRTKYSGFNELDPVTVPDEVKDSAVPF